MIRVGFKTPYTPKSGIELATFNKNIRVIDETDALGKNCCFAKNIETKCMASGCMAWFETKDDELKGYCSKLYVNLII